MLGGVASGKSHVAARLVALAGARVVDADAIAHGVLDAAAADGRLEAALGPDLVRPDGTADRTAVAARVFDDRAALDRLERLVHPDVLERIRAALAEHAAGMGPDLLVLDVPLLLETGLDRRCDALWFVDAPDGLRAERARARGLDEEALRRREARQTPLERKRARADLRLPGDGDVDRAIGEGLASLGVAVRSSG